VPRRVAAAVRQVVDGLLDELRRALAGYSRGTHGVLMGYSRGTHGVLTGYSQVVDGLLDELRPVAHALQAKLLGAIATGNARRRTAEACLSAHAPARGMRFQPALGDIVD
jgi:hypothetical protein